MTFLCMCLYVYVRVLKHVCLCVCVHHLLDVLLEHAELQALVQAHLAVLPDVLQLPLVVQHLVDDVQHAVHRFGVVGRRRQGVSAAGGQRSLQLVQQDLSILAHLEGVQVTTVFI